MSDAKVDSLVFFGFWCLFGFGFCQIVSCATVEEHYKGRQALYKACLDAYGDPNTCAEMARESK